MLAYKELNTASLATALPDGLVDGLDFRKCEKRESGLTDNCDDGREGGSGMRRDVILKS